MKERWGDGGGRECRDSEEGGKEKVREDGWMEEGGRVGGRSEGEGKNEGCME